MILCVCYNISTKDVESALKDGDTSRVQHICSRAGRGCGKCCSEIDKALGISDRTEAMGATRD